MMVHRHTCKTCDNWVDVVSRDGDMMCGECADVMDHAGVVGCVTTVASTPNRDLRELIDHWREHGGPEDKACADELEDVIESEGGGSDGDE